MWPLFPPPLQFPNSPWAKFPSSLGSGAQGCCTSSRNLPPLPKILQGVPLAVSVIPALDQVAITTLHSPQPLSRVSKSIKLWKSKAFLITHLVANSSLDWHKMIYSVFILFIVNIQSLILFCWKNFNFSEETWMCLFMEMLKKMGLQ